MFRWDIVVSLGHCMAVSLLQFYFPGSLDNTMDLSSCSDMWRHPWPLYCVDAHVTLSLSFRTCSRLHLVLSR